MRVNNFLPNDLPHDNGALPFPRNLQAAVSRRALALKRGNERSRAAKANEANMALYARMAAGEEIPPKRSPSSTRAWSAAGRPQTNGRTMKAGARNAR
jgi:hypothetical protein